MKILDAGCGIGRWTKLLKDRFPDAEVTALDHKRRLPQMKGVLFVKGSVEKLPFEDKEFDLVIASRLLPYVDMKIAIKELERVTKEDGFIVYELMQIGYYLQKLLKGNLKRIINFVNWWMYFSIEGKLFNKADNIDSWLITRYFSRFKVAKTISLKKWLGFPVYSLLYMNSKGKVYKKDILKIHKIAKEILNEET